MSWRYVKTLFIKGSEHLEKPAGFDQQYLNHSDTFSGLTRKPGFCGNFPPNTRQGPYLVL